MTSKYSNVAIGDTDNLYDPDVVGDGPVASFLRKQDGTPLRYAAAQYGQPGPTLGMRYADGTDVGPKWAKIGTANYALPINGAHYLAVNTAKTSSADTTYAFIDVRINNDGTYQIVERISGGGNGGSQTVATGTWLRSGQSVAEYQVQFGASNTAPAVVTNSAPGFQPCTSSQVLTLQASTPSRSSATVSATVTVTIWLRRNGSIVSTTTFTAQVTATGFT
jgi:hypothetical protein